ncbi:MAG: cation:proton antiporter [Acholeplasmataceae bacterium]|nr:cation:proton antiporter [Acholeplasmataceae bacterium]
MDIYVFLLFLSVTLLLGFIFGKLAELIKIPEITGYIIAGIILGPSILNLITETTLVSFDVITNFVLGIIAYQIGTELWIPKVRKSGRSIFTITSVQAIATAVIVFAAVYLIDGRMWLALTLSAIATATAPAPIIVMVKKLRAKGPVVDSVVPITGIDDIFGVIIFGLFITIAVGLINGENLNFHSAIIEPLIEVTLSIIIGVILGSFLGLCSKLFVNKLVKRERYIAYLVLSLSTVLFSIWLAHTFALSMILTPMMIGMAFTNFIKKETFEIQGAALSNFSGPLIIIFFTLAGAQLSLSVLESAGIIAIIYIVFRSIGKIGGAYVGAVMAKSPKVVRNSVGLCLLPQGGVEIGMLVAVASLFPEAESILVSTIVLAGILFFELVGPIVFKKTLEVAGESREFESQVITDVAQINDQK